MIALLKRFRAAALAAAACAMVAASPAGAGLRDSLENARDALGCAGTAVFNPMRVVETGMRKFERMTGKEYDRMAEQSMKEAMDECRAAAESIVSRGLGVENFAGKAREFAAAAKGAAEKVAGWFGKGAAPGNRRRALSISDGEKRFYEAEVRVLGAKPLPKVKTPDPPDEITRLLDEARSRNAASWASWEAGTSAPDPWSADADGDAETKSAWDPPTEPDRWDAPETPFAPDADEAGDADGSDYSDALATLERRAKEARRQAEREAEQARRQAEREAEQARRQAEREAEQARRQAERASTSPSFVSSLLSGLLEGGLPEAGLRLYAAKRGISLPSSSGISSGGFDSGSSGSFSSPPSSRPPRLIRRAGGSSGSFSSSPSSGFGSSSSGNSGRGCAETPQCRQATAASNAETARMADSVTGDMSSTEASMRVVKMSDSMIKALRICHAFERLPHCRKEIMAGIRELEKTRDSARHAVREWSGR